MTVKSPRRPIALALPQVSPRITRRTALAGTAALLAAAGWHMNASQAQQATGISAVPVAPAAFLAFSRAITGHSDLSPTTAARIYDAMQADRPGFANAVAELASLISRTDRPEALLAASKGAGLDAIAMAIVSAWYTGTVTTTKAPVVVSYVEALMYRPVSDGLTVPTYCNKGPIWWTGLPPGVKTMPHNEPKVL